MIISKKFLKSVPPNLITNILKKLQNFQESLQQSEGKIREIPAGYWIRKVKNTEIFKFRLNNSDRILFTFLPKRDGMESNILFLNYVSHDEQIRKAENLDINQIGHYQLDINTDKFIDEEIDNKLDIEIENKYLDNGINDIPSVVVKKDYISLIVDKDNEDFLYYLSEEQYEPLKYFGKPIILSGAGGTGKTVVVLNKLINLASKNVKTAYLSYNNLLVEDTKRVFEKFFNEKRKSLPDFYSILEFYAKYLFIDKNKIVTYYDFVNWFKHEQYKFKGLKGIDELAIWTEIRGIIKGYLGLEYSGVLSFLNDNNSRILSLEQYKNLPKGYSNFSEIEKEAIYKVALNYQNWLNEKKLYDENDLAVEIIKKIQAGEIKRYQYLVVDEIQDLSETQLYMVSELVTDKANIFFCGDVHQTINPTFFNFGRIKNLYYSKGLDVQDFNLRKNYRNTKEITDLANILSNVRQKLIGKTSYDYEVQAIRSGKTPIILEASEDNLAYILNIIKDKHYAALIVADEEEKDALIQKYDEAKGRIFTIYEIKGLEYETVFCYNLFSKSQDSWKQILKGNAKRNDRYRYYFNLLYVAISRAKDFLCIIENNHHYMPDILFDSCHFINRADSKDLNIYKSSSENEWAKEAIRLEAIGNKEKSRVARDFSKEKLIQDLNDSRENIIITHENASKIDLNIEKDNRNLKKGIQHLRLQQYNQAIEKLNEYIEEYPLDAEGYYYLGMVYTYAASGTEYSIRYFKEAIRLKPDWYEVYLDKASSLRFIGEYEEAIKTLDKAIEVNNKIGNAYFIKGLLYLEKIEFKKAETYFKKALEFPCYTFDSTNKVWNINPSYEEEKQFKKNIEENLISCKKISPLLIRKRQKRIKEINKRYEELQKLKQQIKKREIDYSLFELEEEKNVISSCMEGKLPMKSTYNSKSKKYVVVFNKEECQLCSKFDTCPMSISDQNGKLRLAKKLLYFK